MALLQPSTLEFLKELAAHNSKEWMDENRKWYQEERERVIDLAKNLHDAFATLETMPLVDPKKSLVRINNNRRFQPDKPLYKNNFGIMINRGEGNCGYFINIEPGASFAGAGVYHPEKEQLAAIRHLVNTRGAELQKIVDQADFKKYFGEIHGAELKTAPRDYPKDHPFIHLLRKKDFTIMYALSDETLCSKNLVKTIKGAYQKGMPFMHFIDDALKLV